VKTTSHKLLISLWKDEGAKRFIRSDATTSKLIHWNHMAKQAGEVRRLFIIEDLFCPFGGAMFDVYRQPLLKCRKCSRVGSVVHRESWETGEPEFFCRPSGGCGEEQHRLRATFQDYLDDLLRIADLCDSLLWLFETNRPDRAQAMLQNMRYDEPTGWGVFSRSTAS
jgi:hypothetical protein